MTPAEITKVIMGEDEKRVEVVVQDEQLSLAIGRRGQNVRLASQLVGVHIDVLTESEELKRRTEHTEKLVKLFMGAFNVDDVMARLLASEGFENVEEIVETEVSDLENIEGFDESLAAELKNRGKAFLEQEYLRQRDAFREAGGDEKLGSLTGLPPKILPALTQGKILTLAQFSDLDVSELLEMGGDSLSEEKAGELIMTARTQTNEKQLGST
jgi:N utilization substance protein A